MLSEALKYFYALFRLKADCAQKNEGKNMIVMVKSGLKKWSCILAMRACYDMGLVKTILLYVTDFEFNSSTKRRQITFTAGTDACSHSREE